MPIRTAISYRGLKMMNSFTPRTDYLYDPFQFGGLKLSGRMYSWSVYGLARAAVWEPYSMRIVCISRSCCLGWICTVEILAVAFVAFADLCGH